MKQEMISYLHTIKNDILNLSTFLYENPEESFCEYKACHYLVEMLKDNNFKVSENYLGIDTSFYAEYGSGHPKLCYICEYDAPVKDGHITGHNLISAMSIGAALSLKKVIDNFKSGTIIVLGCPGEFISGAKVTMSKQGTFKDIDAVLMLHPDTESAGTGTSMALLPVKVKYSGKNILSQSEDRTYSAYDACTLTFNSLSLLKNGFQKNCTIDEISIRNCGSKHLVPAEAELKFYIRAPKMDQACDIEKKLKEFIKAIASVMNIEYEISMPELPYDELIPSHSLSRIFAHNLKEVGIIDTLYPKNTYAGLSIGTVSHLVPCLHSYISIVENSDINYSSMDFARATISEYAKEVALKGASALAMTGLDLLEKEDLVQEIKVEFYDSIKSHEHKPCEV